jgi:hypothetical protein
MIATGFRKKEWEKGALILGLFGLLLFLILICTSVGAWINTKIILEEIEKIKKHIGLAEEKPEEIFNTLDNFENDK